MSNILFHRMFDVIATVISQKGFTNSCHISMRVMILPELGLAPQVWVITGGLLQMCETMSLPGAALSALVSVRRGEGGGGADPRAACRQLNVPVILEIIGRL